MKENCWVLSIGMVNIVKLDTQQHSEVKGRQWDGFCLTKENGVMNYLLKSSSLDFLVYEDL
jgi:hypothetical protein